MKRQLRSRQPDQFVNKILHQFNEREIDINEAMSLLGVGKSQVYNLRTEWLRSQKQLSIGLSGGSHRKTWDVEVKEFIYQSIQIHRQCKTTGINFAYISDELLRQFGFKRTSSAIRRFALKQWPNIVSNHSKHPKHFRRWEKVRAGELWQHDTTPMHIGENNLPASLILSLDDATREVVSISIVEKENLWAHFEHFRYAFAASGLPIAVYTDGFTMFGKAGEDLVTKCGRMFRAFEIGHIIASSPQAKGKIERNIGTFQRRLEPLFMQHKVNTYEAANQIAREFATWWNNNHIHKRSGYTAHDHVERCRNTKLWAYRPPPANALLRLHLAQHIRRYVSSANTIEFNGRTYHINPIHYKQVWLIVHPDREFWVVSCKPNPLSPQWPNILGHFSL